MAPKDTPTTSGYESDKYKFKEQPEADTTPVGSWEVGRDWLNNMINEHASRIEAGLPVPAVGIVNEIQKAFKPVWKDMGGGNWRSLISHTYLYLKVNDAKYHVYYLMPQIHPDDNTSKLMDMRQPQLNVMHKIPVFKGHKGLVRTLSDPAKANWKALPSTVLPPPAGCSWSILQETDAGKIWYTVEAKEFGRWTVHHITRELIRCPSDVPAIPCLPLSDSGPLLWDEEK
jgi:hypothetical protein